MPVFKPYTIHHLQLSEIEEFQVPEGNAYLVFWWNRIPLGHSWMEAPTTGIANNDGFRSRIPANTIAEKIGPTLRYYLEGPEKKIADGTIQTLQTLLTTGEFSRLHGWLNENLQDPLKSRYTAAVLPGTAPEKLSVVICTRNRPAAIETCVKALLSSVDPDFELIVVDNAPDDDSTEQVLRRFPGVRYVREPRKGLDIARNTGARFASNALIAYTDDDVLVSPEWTKLLKSCFADPLVMAVTGLVIPQSLQTHSQYVFEHSWGFNKGYLPRLFDHRYFLDNCDSGVRVWDIGAGANMAFRREAFELVGWFDERLDVGAAGCSGDSEFWYRLLAEGWGCLYTPHLFVYHLHRETEKELKRQLFAYMRGQVCSLLVQYQLYRHKGNLSRLYRGIPKYYFQRIRDRFLKKDKGDTGNLTAEIKGCFSGWWYYQRHRNTPRFSSQEPPPALSREAIVRPDTLVSVIIPCYNQGGYLPDAVESVLAQSHSHVEVIVVDDGSSDNTAEVCRQYSEQLNQEDGSRRFHAIRVERVGLSAARNIGVQYSHGSYVAFLDSDDWLYPGAIACNLSYFSKDPKLVFVSGAHDRVDGHRNPIPGKPAVEKSGDNFWSLLHGNYIAMEATVLYRREVFFHFHFDPRLKGCEDYDLNLKVTRHFPVLGHTERIAAYRIHGQNMSNNRKMMLDTALQVLKKQEKGLKNKAERDAYNEGVRNWKKYYASRPGKA